MDEAVKIGTQDVWKVGSENEFDLFFYDGFKHVSALVFTTKTCGRVTLHSGEIKALKVFLDKIFSEGYYFYAEDVPKDSVTVEKTKPTI